MKKGKVALDHIPPFREMPAGKRKDLENLAEKIDLRSRGVLFDTGGTANKVYYLVSGGLKLQRKGPNRRTYILDFVAPGTLFGYTESLAGSSRTERAIAMQPSTVLVLPASKFLDAVGSSPSSAQALPHLLASQVKTDHDRMEEGAVLNLRTRLIYLLHRLTRDFGQKVKGGTMINLKITHQDMADYLGASRESVTVAISNMRKHKLLRLDVRRIVVFDLRQLLKS